MRYPHLLILLLFSLSAICSAQTVRIQGKEFPYKLVDGQQMIEKSLLAEAFPGYSAGEGTVDLAVLLKNPNARVVKRNGLIVSVRYYDSAMAQMYEQYGSEREQTEGKASPVEASSFQQIMNEIVRLSNLERVKHGELALSADSLLDVSATGHSEEMAKLDFFSHSSPTEGRVTPQDRIRLAGSGANTTGENIAMFTGLPASTVAAQAVTGWMNSPGHRKNLLSPNFTHIGIGVGQRGDTFYLTQNFAAYR